MLNGDEKPICGDPGRLMFFDSIGRYFETPIKFKEAAPGTACPTCGATDVPLWINVSGNPTCRAQQSITAKRYARKNEEEPLEVVSPNKKGSTAFAKGSIALAGKGWGRVWTKLQPTSAPPSNALEISFPPTGNQNRVLLDVLRNPPDEPFVLIIFDEAAKGRLEVTIDPSRIIDAGPNGYVIDRNEVMRLIDLFEGVTPREAKEIFSLRERIIRGETHEEDQLVLNDLRRDHPTIFDALGSFPAFGSIASRVIQHSLKD